MNQLLFYQRVARTGKRDVDVTPGVTGFFVGIHEGLSTGVRDGFSLYDFVEGL